MCTRITHHLSGLIFITMAVASVCQAKQSKLKYRLDSALTYKRADGQVVQMSPSQQAIAKGQWRHLDPTEIYQRNASMVVEVIGDAKKGDGMVSQGTGYFLNQDTILTNWHVINSSHCTHYSPRGERKSVGKGSLAASY
jgi:hypothetical protein